MNIWKMDGINNTGDAVQKCWRLLKAGMTCTARAEFQGFNFLFFFFLEGLNTDPAMPEKNKVVFFPRKNKVFPSSSVCSMFSPDTENLPWFEYLNSCVSEPRHGEMSDIGLGSINAFFYYENWSQITILNLPSLGCLLFQTKQKKISSSPSQNCSRIQIQSKGYNFSSDGFCWHSQD